MDLKKDEIKPFSACIERMNFNDLDNDCLLEVFKYFSTIEKLEISLVCTRWASLLVKNLDLKYKLFEDYLKLHSISEYSDDNKFLNLIINIVTMCGSYINSFSFNNMGVFVKINKILIEMEKHCSNITEISMSHLRFNDNLNLSTLFKNNPNLCKISLEHMRLDENCLLNLKADFIKEIRLHFCHVNVKPISKFYEFLSKLKNIRKIHIDKVDKIEELHALNLSKCKNLNELSLNFPHIKFNGTNELNKLIYRQKNLQVLKLKNTDIHEQLINCISKDTLETFEADFYRDLSYNSFQFKNLKVLKCQVFICRDEFTKIFKQCQKLKEVDIRIGDYHLTETGERCFSDLKNLEIFTIGAFGHYIDKILLSVSQCENLKDIIIYGPISKIGLKSISLFKNLEYLYFYPDLITDDQFCELVKNLLKLKQLTIKYAKNVSNEFLNKADELKNKRKDKHPLKIIYSGSSKIRPAEVKISSLIILEKYVEKFY